MTVSDQKFTLPFFRKIKNSYHFFYFKDAEPTEDDIAPQFAFGSDWKIAQKSMDDDFVIPGREDEDWRPNFYRKPYGNWADLRLTGWKIHHTNEKNWARNGEVHMNDWQFSDNTRGYIIKGEHRVNK